jgi:hypothetical protein
MLRLKAGSLKSKVGGGIVWLFAPDKIIFPPN